MSQDPAFAELSDDELRALVKQQKARALTHAVLIGFLIGIVIYSVAKNTWGLVTLIPLFLIYRLTRNQNDGTALLQELNSRGLW